MSSLQIRAARLVEAERTHLIRGRSTYKFWQGLELQGSPWTPYPITWKQGGAKKPRYVDPRSLWGRRKGPVAANPFASSKGWTRLETGPVTCPHQYQSKTESEARPPRHRDDAPPPTGQDQVHIGPNPTFQAGERVWYLDTQPSKLDPNRMD